MVGVIVGVLLGLVLACAAAAQPEFRVSRDGAIEPGPVGGRLVVYLMREDANLRGEPADAPFFRDPQPMAGADVANWTPTDVAGIDENADWFGFDRLEPGWYRAQAVLDRKRLSSSWRDEPGNLFSSVRRFEIREDQAGPIVPLHMDRVVVPEPPPAADRVRYHAFQSNLLSDARDTPVSIEVGVIEPIGFNAADARRYPVVYEVPGFGGTHRGAARRAERLAEADPSSHLGRLARSAYWIVLNPEGPNGHHLFSDSSCNGPVGRSLVSEIIPQIDAIYPTVATPEGRLLRGHSSGGWAVVHLAMTYPETFGGAWSSAPDPLDFRAFQSVDIYNDDNMFVHANGDPVPSYTARDGTVRMTVREENDMERVMGWANTSGQQWDSWQAVFGGCDEDGSPLALFDESTGAIDPRVADFYRRADLSERVNRDPADAARLARTRVRVIVGDADEYELDRGVRLFVERLEPYSFDDEHGWAVFVPGATHGSVLDSGAARRLEQDMLEHLIRSGLTG